MFVVGGWWLLVACCVLCVIRSWLFVAYILWFVVRCVDLFLVVCCMFYCLAVVVGLSVVGGFSLVAVVRLFLFVV